MFDRQLAETFSGLCTLLRFVSGQIGKKQCRCTVGMVFIRMLTAGVMSQSRIGLKTNPYPYYENLETT